MPFAVPPCPSRLVVATITFYGDHLHNDHERIRARTLVTGRGCEFAALLVRLVAWKSGQR
jgi:hypothetical protein